MLAVVARRLGGQLEVAAPALLRAVTTSGAAQAPVHAEEEVYNRCGRWAGAGAAPRGGLGTHGCKR